MRGSEARGGARIIGPLLVVVAVVAGASGVGIGATSAPNVALSHGSMGSGGGNVSGGDYGLTVDAGQTGLGDSSGGNIGISGGAAVRADACPSVGGVDDRQGCDLALEPQVDLHVVDHANSGACRSLTGVDGPSCVAPIRGAKVKVFDREELDGLRIAKLGGGEVTLTKNPKSDLYDDVFEASAAGAAAAAKFGCVTLGTGSCLTGLESRGDHLVILRWQTPDSGLRQVYTGLPYDASAFVDTDGDGSLDLATKQLQVLKTVAKDGTITYTGGSKSVVRGSYLELVRPDRVEWGSTARTYLYPFALTADSLWDVRLCATLPTGYGVAAVLDESSSPLTVATTLAGTCTTRSIKRGERLSVSFDVVRLTALAGKVPLLTVTATTFHDGATKTVTMTVPASLASLSGVVGS